MKDRLGRFKKIFIFDIRDLIIASATLIAFLIFVPIFTYIVFAKDLGSMEAIMNRKDTGVILLDDQDKPFFTFYQAKYKSFIPISQIPKITQKAVISSEDKGFYSHPGFSIDSIIRSLYSDITSKELSYGGSTITQQLVKNSLLSSNKNFLRKYQEIVLAQEVERRYTKDQILEMYLNSVYFGAGAFGVEEASQSYFNKSANDLDLSQSALLAGLLPAPSELSPIGNSPDQAILRQKIILQKMQQQGYINAQQQIQAENEKLTFKDTNDTLNSQAPHFALMVRDELNKKFGEEYIARSGFKVHTSINLPWQSFAERTVRDQVNNLKGDNVSNGAAVVIDPKTGEIKALVGSVDWYDNKFGKVNVALSKRQPGSSFKPIVYSAALQRLIITPSTILHDQPTTFDNCPGANQDQLKDSRCQYKPVDFDRGYRGLVTVRRALANSLNIPAVEVMSKVGVPTTLDQAKILGITTLGNDSSNYGLSLVLGAGDVRLLDMAGVYSVFANKGEKVDPADIISIEDKYGHSVYSYYPNPQPVLDPDVAFQISSILSDNGSRAEEFGNALTISRPAAVKTGTTENFKDAWTLGYTPSLVVGVWIGNNDGTLMDNVAGSLGPAPIWKNLMEYYLAGTPIEQFKPPIDIVEKEICISSSSARLEYFISGTTPSQSCAAPKPSGSAAVEGAASSPTPVLPVPAPPNLPPGKEKKH